MKQLTIVLTVALDVGSFWPAGVGLPSRSDAVIQARIDAASAVGGASEGLTLVGKRGVDPCDTVGLIRLTEIGVARGCD